jgi:alpha-amylase
MKILRTAMIVCVLALLLVACSLGSAPADAPATGTETTETTIEPTAPADAIPSEELTWWEDRVFYEVFVRSFQDSDGDGVGDINGLIQKLDYLQSLGIRGIWLMPMAESPSYHGYDVVDYYSVDQEYGTKEDFLRLMDEAHKRDIRVVVDLVLNHSSSEHPYFLESKEPDSDKRDWYVWSDEKPSGPGWHQSGDSYYYGIFWEGMPDLNYENPEVTAEMLNVVRYWIEEMNVDGYRLDAIKFLIEGDVSNESTPETHAWLKEFYTFYKEVDPTAFTVAEVWTTTTVASKYVGDEVDTVFEFDLARAMIQAAARGNKSSVESALAQSLEAFPNGQFATFLANHDQKRTRSSLFSEEQAKVAATMQLTLPGIPFIYYGEEIGMEGDKPDENIRRPMQWNGEEGVGFTTGTPWNEPFEDYPERNVAAQEGDPASLLSHYRTLIALRNEYPALQGSDFVQVETDSNRVLAYLRPGTESTMLVVINLHREAATDYSLDLDAGPLITISTTNLLMGDGEITPPEITNGGFAGYQPLDTLPPHSSTIIELVP